VRRLVVLAAVLAGCAQVPAATCTGLPGSPGITAELFFGRTQAGGLIDATAWQDFLATEVTPRFPDGLTVIDAHGQWRQRSSRKVISEVSTIVEIATDAAPATIERLEAIRAAYRTRFHQESVGLVVTPNCASF
jgi:hypothetical protein